MVDWLNSLWSHCGSWRRSLLLLVLILLLWSGGTSGAIAFPRSFFINQARLQPDGCEVIVTGRVTVPSGTFGSANLDQGFAIQDSTSGIYVTTDRDWHFQAGDMLEIKGILQDDGHGQRMVRLTDWHRSLLALPLPSPRPVLAKQVGKPSAGQLVTVTGDIVRSVRADAPYGDRLWLQDASGEVQIYMPKSTQIAPEQLSFLVEGKALQVTGFSSQFDGHDEVIPRSRDDIVLME